MFLGLVDSNSKWLEAYIMSKITAPATTDYTLLTSHSCDNRPTLMNEVFQEFMETNGIYHVHTAARL